MAVAVISFSLVQFTAVPINIYCLPGSPLQVPTANAW
jgi:hypothetical protein